MRGADEQQSILFSYRSIEDRIPSDHPLRAMRQLVDPLLSELSPRFQALYATTGRPSIPPEQLLRALLLQDGHHATRRTEPACTADSQRGGWAHHAASKLRDEPAQTKTGGRVFWLAEMCWATQEAAPQGARQGELDLHLCERSIQSRAVTTADDAVRRMKTDARARAQRHPVTPR